MDDGQILATISTLIEKLFRKKNLGIGPHTVASDVDGWDSLSHALLMIRVEKTFGIKFSNVEIGRIKSVGELVDLVKAKR